MQPTVPVVLVHGWQADRRVWHDVIEAIEPPLRATALDLPGSGEMAAAPGPYTLERFAADLRDRVRSLELGPVFVAGHSMGATVALRLAVDCPQLIRGLVLVAPVPASGGGYSPKGEAYLRGTAGNPDAVRAWLAKTFAKEPDEATLDALCDAAALTRRETALESFESWAFANFADATRFVDVPTLVIAPEHDAPENVERRVSALLPNAEHVVLSGAAHYAILEKPRQIATLMTSFILRHARNDDAG